MMMDDDQRKKAIGAILVGSGMLAYDLYKASTIFILHETVYVKNGVTVIPNWFNALFVLFGAAIGVGTVLRGRQLLARLKK